MLNKEDYKRSWDHCVRAYSPYLKNVVMNGVEYRQIGDLDPNWHLYSTGKLAAHQHYFLAIDGSNRVIVGPEKLTNGCDFEDDYYYVSALGDYYRADYCIYRQGMWVGAYGRNGDKATFVIHTDESGFIENMLLNAPKPIGKLEKMQFELKDLVEAEKGKKLTVHDQIKWFKDHPTVELLYGSDEKERYERMSRILRAYPKEADL